MGLYGIYCVLRRYGKTINSQRYIAEAQTWHCGHANDRQAAVDGAFIYVRGFFVVLASVTASAADVAPQIIV